MNTPEMNPPDPPRKTLAQTRAHSKNALVLAGLARAQLRAMAAAIPSIEADADDEALHDFRVALRRLRTLLPLVGDDHAPRLAAQCDRGLRRLTRLTGARRDLDVVLRDGASRTARQEAIMPVAALLQRERRRAQRQLLTLLRNSRTRQTLAATERLLAACEAAPAPRPADVLERLHAAGRKLRRRLRRARRETTVARLHAARKAGKRLRYLLEALPALYPNRIRRRATGSAIADLKSVQDALGSICDLSVRAALLAELSARHAAAIERSGGVPADLAKFSAMLQAQADTAARDAARRLGAMPSSLPDDYAVLFTRRAPRAR